MASPNPVRRAHRWILRLGYLLPVAVFLWACVRFYIPGQGFTYLVIFGDRQLSRYLPELQARSFYLERDSSGYDAQYYAQIAMHPHFDATLRSAVDSLPYRARRILFCATASLLGGGDPGRALAVFAVQNIVAWLLLAWMLLRWFPPTHWENWIRWVATLFTFGLTFSVRGALVDGPSLLLIAVGMALWEAGRPWWSAVILGVSGLGKETNLLGAAAYVPAQARSGNDWRSAAGRVALAAAPLLLWLTYLHFKLGQAGDAGARNFDWPFAGYARKWREVLPDVSQRDFDPTSAFVMLALTVQWAFFALRPRWSDAWWRLGAAYAALMVVLGDAVWEGYPGAAPRVLLPMTLAFNIALPRGRRWWLLLVLGNLLVWRSYDMLKPPPVHSFQVTGPNVLCVEQSTGDEVQARFPDHQWYQLERSYFDYWQWARGPAKVILHNPHPYAVRANLMFQLKTPDGRTIAVRYGDRVEWSGPTTSSPHVTISDIILPPGDSPLAIDTRDQGVPAGPHDSRQLSYRVCQFTIAVLAKNDPSPPVSPSTK